MALTKLIDYVDGKLWGIAGGQLEYVSQRIEYRKNDQGWDRVMIIRFTDHDCQASPNAHLIEGKYYDLEFPMRPANE